MAYYSSFPDIRISIPEEDIGKLGFCTKEIVNSFLHALQTFSMDEDYTGYWLNGQAMIGYILPGSDLARIVYNIFMGLLNIMAPVVGGAIVFEMLTKAFPSIKLFFSNFIIWKEKYYFSELNENSLALARSILSDPSRRRSALVFTDAYADDEEEESTEWLSEAKAMGAVCLKADLLHIAYNKLNRKGTHIFLIDKAENNNVGILSGMLDEKKIITYQNACIYVFSNDRKYSCIEDEVSRLVSIEEEKVRQYNDKTADRKNKIKMPYIVPINIVRNMADTLMQEVPLFEPLTGTEQKQLTVTIIGGGSIGTEMFLAAYRYGQILDVKLNINVISKEPEKTIGGHTGFNNKIDFINPEILRSADPKDKMLIYNCDPSHPERSEPYMDYSYYSFDVMTDSFIEEITNDERLLDTDYFIIALGNDEDNFLIADRIKCIVGRHHMFSAPEKKTVIAFSIYNPDLANKLNEFPQRRYVKNSECSDVFMYAFGCKDDVYSCNNVFFEGISYSAFLTGKNYEKHAGMNAVKAREENEEIVYRHHEKMIKDIYNHKSSMARLMHLKYKFFSAGDYFTDEETHSIFSKDYNPSDSDSYNRKRLARYKEHFKIVDESDRLWHRLAWLEHRRWNAFMRTCGFRSVSADKIKTYYSLKCFEHPDANHKFISLKLHPCIVECSENGMMIPFSVSKYSDDNPITKEKYEAEIKDIRNYYSANLTDKLDALDEVTFCIWEQAVSERFRKEKNKSEKEHEPVDYLKLYNCFSYDDFKRWDYPSEEEIDENLFRNYKA